MVLLCNEETAGPAAVLVLHVAAASCEGGAARALIPVRAVATLVQAACAALAEAGDAGDGTVSALDAPRAAFDAAAVLPLAALVAAAPPLSLGGAG